MYPWSIGEELTDFPWGKIRYLSAFSADLCTCNWFAVILHTSYLALDKMPTISHKIFSGAFSLMKGFVFRLKFHWSLFLRVDLTITQHWFRWWLGARRWHAIILTKADWIHWRKYAALGGDELTFRRYCLCQIRLVDQKTSFTLASNIPRRFECCFTNAWFSHLCCYVVNLITETADICGGMSLYWMISPLKTFV